MTEKPDWLTEWAYTARWFVCPIALAGWFLAKTLTYVFGFSMRGHPDGYVQIFLIGMNSKLHEFVPLWLAYLYDGASVLVIASIALIAFCWIVEPDRPEP